MKVKLRGAWLPAVLIGISIGTFAIFNQTKADASNPSVSNVAISNVTDNQAIVTWTSTSSDVSLIRFGSSDTVAGRNLTASSSASVTSHQLTLTNLTASTTYFIRVVSGSQSGSPVESLSYSFTTLATNPANQISNVNFTAITDTSAMVSWTSSSSDISLVNYGTTDTTTGRNLTASSSAMTMNHGLTLSGLAPGTTYYVRIVSNSQSGSPVESSTSSFTTLAANPMISNVDISDITDNSAVISWTSSSSDIALIKYGLSDTTAGRNLTASSSQTGTDHELTLSGLTASSTYYFRIVSSGNPSTESATYSFMTPAIGQGGGYGGGHHDHHDHGYNGYNGGYKGSDQNNYSSRHDGNGYDGHGYNGSGNGYQNQGDNRGSGNHDGYSAGRDNDGYHGGDNGNHGSNGYNNGGYGRSGGSSDSGHQSGNSGRHGR